MCVVVQYEPHTTQRYSTALSWYAMSRDKVWCHSAIKCGRFNYRDLSGKLWALSLGSSMVSSGVVLSTNLKASLKHSHVVYIDGNAATTPSCKTSYSGGYLSHPNPLIAVLTQTVSYLTHTRTPHSGPKRG